MRRFWVQLLTVIVLGYAVGTGLSIYQRHVHPPIIPAPAPPDAGVPHITYGDGDCGSYSEDEECES